jgi:hypothetical protein
LLGLRGSFAGFAGRVYRRFEYLNRSNQVPVVSLAQSSSGIMFTYFLL